MRIPTIIVVSRLLNLAVAALHDQIAYGGFHNKTKDQIKQEYEEKTSDVSAFLIQEGIVNTQNPEYLTTDLYAAYVNFCRGRRVLPFIIDVICIIDD